MKQSGVVALRISLFEYDETSPAKLQQRPNGIRLKVESANLP